MDDSICSTQAEGLTVEEILAKTAAERQRELTCREKFQDWRRHYCQLHRFFVVQVLASCVFWCAFAGSTMKSEDIYGRQTYTTVFYGMLIMINALFSCYYAVVGIRAENNFQLGCYAATTITLMVRGSLRVRRGSEGAGSYLLFSVSSMLSVTTLACIYPVCRGFGWKAFRKCQGNRTLQRAYMHYEMFLAFVRLDVQFLTMCFVLFLCFLDSSEILCIPLILVSYPSDLVIQWAVKREVTALTAVWLFFKFCMPAFWLYTLVRYLGCYSDFDSCTLLGCADSGDADAPSADGGATATVLPPVIERYHDDCLRKDVAQKAWIREAFLMIVVQALIVRLLLLVSTVLVMRNFGCGLKEKVFGMGSPDTGVSGSAPDSDPLQEGLMPGQSGGNKGDGDEGIAMCDSPSTRGSAGKRHIAVAC